jgi:hypothetical protein
MFCSHCGAEASGNFCSSCGSRLTSSDGASLVPGAWQEECRYQVLLHFPEVRDLIAKHAAKSQKGMTGEQILGLFDKAFKPIDGVSLTTVASIAIPIYSHLGVETGKQRTAFTSYPIGKTVVAIVCSLARYGRTLKQVHQGEDGCVLEAVLPSDIWSFEGQLVISVQRTEEWTQVEAATKIPGQLYDWGKSNQCLDQLFDDLESLLEKV